MTFVYTFSFVINDHAFFTLIISVNIFPLWPALCPCALCTLTPPSIPMCHTNALTALTDAFFD